MQTEIFNQKLKTVMKILYSLLLIITLSLTQFLPTAHSQIDGAELFGYWDLEFDINGETQPGWLHAKRSGTRTIVGEIVGTSGSTRPISQISYNPNSEMFSFSIPPQWESVDSNLTFTFSLQENKIQGVMEMGNENYTFTGVSAPKLVRDTPPIWQTPVNLLDDNMSKWIIPKNNQFVMENGILVNKAMGGNLITTELFDDFKLHVEFRYPERSNSGIYLRGRYEVQIEDNTSQIVSKVGIGGIYGFIEPSVFAAKSAGEWQTYDITLVGRMITVVLNGVEVISNRSIPGITGGALDSREGEPGPIMIQGDHGPVEFRNITITPAM
tara:strand:+ start:77803 stop:78780 length:978 start_codon:yes stop_codon:yes gene_type:complete